MLGLSILYVLLWGSVVYGIVLKIYLEKSRGKFTGKERLDGKVVLITGATQGIGVEVARDLIRRGCRLWIACRDLKRGQEVAQDLGGDCKLLRMDLCSLTSVRRAARHLIEKEPRLDILINNAAVIPARTNIFTEDGFEATYQTNYLSVVYLTLLLFEILRKSPSARVVNVSSNLHHVGFLGCISEDATREHSWFESPLQMYSNSKFALNMVTKELAKLFQPENIHVNTVHPGATKTKITLQGTTSMALFFHFVYHLFGKSPEEAAQAITYVAVSKDLEGVTGKYFVDCGVGWDNWRVNDPDRRRKLFEDTCRLLDLPSP
ncbi:retinol dehydrogenase 13 [Galendromus occidentalis]|uniref:Retinol dehydrogenase 13 n=1 Tax=Galendromus occidentalis TaxID=34638 RepID=A0AAJ7L879_9ACAR|nr:retinol dehydrogenase 13 [Galendromus occidentalis]